MFFSGAQNDNSNYFFLRRPAGAYGLALGPRPHLRTLVNLIDHDCNGINGLIDPRARSTPRQQQLLILVGWLLFAAAVVVVEATVLSESLALVLGPVESGEYLVHDSAGAVMDSAA